METSVDTLLVNERPAERGRIASTWRSIAALRAGVIAGAMSGAVFGGVGGRIVMRIVALIDQSAYGVRTDSGATVGEITAGGTIGLTIVTMLAAIICGVLYIALRRWLPGSGVVRGLAFGVLLVFGPGFIAIGETDLQIFEPALPIFAMFAALEVFHGLLVALIVDRLHPASPIRPGRRLAAALRGCIASLPQQYACSLSYSRCTSSMARAPV
jgi:hypothetical protein